MKKRLILSPLKHTWILDLDGTLLKHNAYKNGKDEILNGVKEFLNQIPKDDFILILTAREKEARAQTLNFLTQNGIRFDEIIFEMPMGERILINDDKPSGLKCAHCVNLKRDGGVKNLEIFIDKNL